MHRRWVFTMALVLGPLSTGLAGCATTLLPPPSDLPWQQGRLLLNIAATAERAARSESASFELRGDSSAGELRLSTPLGTLLAVASWSQGKAEVVTPSGHASFNTLAELATQTLGEDFPLQALPDWLQGRPWPAAAHRPGEAQFEQLGWLIDTSRLADGMLQARRDAAPALQLRVRLER
jgi:outer membrane lipoprotein LolB